METMETMEKSVIQKAHQELKKMSGLFKYKVNFVPNDRMEWSPAETAKGTREIVAHCALVNYAFASVFSGESMGGAPEADKQFEWIFTNQKVHRSRDEVMTLFDESFDALSSVLSSMPESKLDEVVATPFGDMMVRDFIDSPALHVFSHAAQIDYLQTCWNDQEFYFPQGDTELG
jgi:uncharacterized damage-inducible protein DinB